MLSVHQMEEMGMLNSLHRQRSRVVTTTYTVLEIKEDAVKNEEKMADLREGIKLYSDASKHAMGKVSNQYGIHVDPSKGTGEVHMFSMYACPAALDSHIGKVLDTYCNKILPYTDMKELVATTGEEDMEFWTNSLAGYGSQASRLSILENVNDPQKEPYVDPTPASVEELVAMGLPNDFAQDCYDTTVEGDPIPSSHRAVLQTVLKIKEDVIGDEQKIHDMKKIIMKYADAARTTEGKLACEVALSEEHNDIFILEHFNGKEASMNHIGRTLKYAVELFQYAYLDKLVVSCAKEDMEYFEQCGDIFKPKSEMIVMECMD